MEAIIITSPDEIKNIISDAVNAVLKATPNQPKPKEELYTLHEVMGLLRVTRTTLTNWNRSGHLEAIRIGRVYRYKKSVIDKFLEVSSLGTTD